MEREPKTNEFKLAIAITIILAITMLALFLFMGLSKIFKIILIIAVILFLIAWIKSTIDYFKSIK